MAGTGLTTFTSSTAVSKSEIDDRIETIEDYINAGCVQNDWNTDIVDTMHIAAPRFFGAPAPRMLGDLTDIHWRGTLEDSFHRASIHHGATGNTTYVPVNGMCATFKARATTYLNVRVSMHARTLGGSLSNTFATGEYEAHQVGTFALFVNGAQKGGTARRLYANVGGGTYRDISAQKQVPMVADLALSGGIHSIGVYFKPEVPGDSDADGSLDWKHIFVTSRMLIARGDFR